MNEQSNDKLISDKEVARLFGMSPAWVRCQRHKRRRGKEHFLKLDPVMVGSKSPRYRLSETQEFFKTVY